MRRKEKLLKQAEEFFFIWLLVQFIIRFLNNMFKYIIEWLFKYLNNHFKTRTVYILWI